MHTIHANVYKQYKCMQLTSDYNAYKCTPYVQM